MSLQDKLATRLAGRPIRVGLIGAGKFGSMFLSQVPAIAGIESRGTVGDACGEPCPSN